MTTKQTINHIQNKLDAGEEFVSVTIIDELTNRIELNVHDVEKRGQTFILIERGLGKKTEVNSSFINKIKILF